MAELRSALEGRYILGEVLGSGRGGITMRAHHIASKKDVAVKVAWNDSSARVRVLRETVLTAKVGHTCSLAVRDIQAPEPMLVVEMPLALGGTLSDLLESGQPVPFPYVLRLMRGIGGALDQAHAAGIIHGGLRPVKILLDEAGNPIVTDFEIRIPRRADWDVARPSEVGAQAYMPLEQRHDYDSVDGRIDQYALAIMAYELLRGRTTWRINDEGVLEIDAIEIMVHRPIAPGAPLSASMAVKRATAKDPAFRYASVDAFVRAFSGEVPEVVAKAHIHREEVTQKKRRSHVWVLIPVALGAAVIAVRPDSRDAVANMWRDRWPFGSVSAPSSRDFVPGFPDNVAAAPSREESGRMNASGQPTNTRVGDSTPTGGQTPTGGGTSTSPRTLSSTTTDPAPSSRGPNTRRPSGSPAPVVSGPAGSSRNARDTVTRRSAQGGEITNRPASAANPAAPTGDGVIVVSLDSDARAVVVVDGRTRGTTPLTLRLSPGSHVVSVRASDGFAPASRTIVLAAGDTTRATFSLGRRP